VPGNPGPSISRPRPELRLRLWKNPPTDCQEAPRIIDHPLSLSASDDGACVISYSLEEALGMFWTTFLSVLSLASTSVMAGSNLLARSLYFGGFHMISVPMADLQRIRRYLNDIQSFAFRSRSLRPHAHNHAHHGGFKASEPYLSLLSL
jgi:hypothetical protein